MGGRAVSCLRVMICIDQAQSQQTVIIDALGQHEFDIGQGGCCLHSRLLRICEFAVRIKAALS